MKYITDILQLEGKWSLSRSLLIIIFFIMLGSWVGGLAEIGSGIVSVFGMLLAYAMGDKIQNLFKEKSEPEIFE